jgi:hypothetical protein
VPKYDIDESRRRRTDPVGDPIPNLNQHNGGE